MTEIIKYNPLKGAVLPAAVIIMTMVIITIIIIWLLFVTEPQPQARLEQLVPVKVMLAEVKSQPVRPYEQVTGRLRPLKTAQIRFQVAGNVVARKVEPGRQVKRGQVLMRLQDQDYRDQLQQAAAQLVIEEKSVSRDQNLLAYARNNLQLQQQEEQRLAALAKQNLIAQSRLDSTRQRRFDLQAEVARLQYSVATNHARIRMRTAQSSIAQRNLDRSVLIAPFDGIINEVFLDEGDYVNANQAALTLVDISQFDVQLNVRAAVMAGLGLKQMVSVRINDHQSQGEIVALQPDPDISTNTHQIRVRVANRQALPGLLAIVELPLPAPSRALLVPVSAVLNAHAKSFVFVYENNMIRKTAVQLGRRVNSTYIVRQGLLAGQKIVARDATGLADQQTVITE